MSEIAEGFSKISKRKLRSIVNDEEKTAIAANLVYVSDKEPGIERRKKGEKFSYYYKNKIIKVGRL